MTTKTYKIYGRHLIEQNTIDQFIGAMAPDWVIRGALMPDAHYGYSMPIGGVILTDHGYVVPAWVGYDIGCGVCFVETTYKPHEVDELRKEILVAIKQRVPVGFKHHKRIVMAHGYPGRASDWLRKRYVERNGDYQIGTMGGNNHFIEVGISSKGKVCIVIHSGSRGIGHDVAQHYMKIAGGGKAREGNYPLSTGSHDGRNYLRDMRFMLDFALKNRKVMLMLIHQAMVDLGLKGDIEWDTLINNTHNHAEETVHGVIHRKGATKADDGVLGVVPGSPSVGSYIVRGRGNADSLWSSSHGAGRTMGRGKKAQEQLDLNEFASDMQGIAAEVSEARLVESPRAYKSPRAVMQEQLELISVVDYVKPLVCVKG
jgi:tRNA-splicing ligase RtcB